MITTMFTMLAFAGVYALIAAMVGGAWPAISTALRGGVALQEIAGVAASRRFNRA